MNSHTSPLSTEKQQQLLDTLKDRFDKNGHRHPGIEWASIQAKLVNNAAKLWSLQEMERTGGEPDVIDYNAATDEYLFCDCAPESPVGRRSTCYDLEGLQSRKENKPENNAVDMAEKMGVWLLSEEQYRTLQQLEAFDTKTSSWIRTPASIRQRGGALFCDRRYDQVFTYHNGAASYYAARGFRALLKV